MLIFGSGVAVGIVVVVLVGEIGFGTVAVSLENKIAMVIAKDRLAKRETIRI